MGLVRLGGDGVLVSLILGLLVLERSLFEVRIGFLTGLLGAELASVAGECR